MPAEKPMHPRKRAFDAAFRHFPLLAADGVVVRGDTVLLIRRGWAPFKGKWALPGGFVDKGETVERAVVREVEEESGIVAKVVRLIGMYSNPRRDPRGHIISAAFLLAPVRGTPRPSTETTDARWFPARALPPLAADHAVIIRDAFKILKEQRR